MTFLPARPLDEECGCMVCQRYTRAFLHPLAAKGLPFAANLISYHNIAFMMVGGPLHAQPAARLHDPMPLSVPRPQRFPSVHPKLAAAPAPPSMQPWVCSSFPRSACPAKSEMPSRAGGIPSLFGSTWHGSTLAATCLIG
jgi:hypothetical protein